MRSPLDLLQLALEMGQRPVVLWQLLGIAIALSASALLIRVRKGADQFWLMPIASLLLGFLALLLASIGIPNEIILVIAAVFGSLTLLQVIYALLRKLRMEATLDRLFSRFARPAVIVISVALLIRAAGFEDLWSVSILPANAGGQYPLRITIGEIARSLIAFYLLFITSGLASKAGSIASKLSLGASTESSAIIAELSRYIYIFLGLIFILMSMGITGNFLIAIAASLSVGIGFGVKDIAANFISGIWLLLEGVIRPGDVIYIDQDPCRVNRLGPRAARLWRERDNADLVVPNLQFFSDTTTTYTSTDRLRRAEVQVRAALNHKPSEVIALLEQIPTKIDGVLTSRPPSALLIDYEPAAILYSLRFMINDPMRNIGITSSVR
ncbi:MAG: mechanosensitive ion channel family protein, partial [Prochlorococcus sp.]